MEILYAEIPKIAFSDIKVWFARIVFFDMQRIFQNICYLTRNAAKTRSQVFKTSSFIVRACVRFDM